MFSERTRALLATVLIAGPCLVVSPPVVDAAVSETRLQRLNFIYRFQQGKNYWSSNSYLEAAAYFESLMEQYDSLPRPLQLQVNYYLGTSYHELSLFGDALDQLEPLLDNPFAPDLLVDVASRLMDIYAQRGDRATAEQIYEHMTRRPLSPRLRVKVDYGAAQAYYRLGRYDRVRELALRISPDSPEYPRAMLLSSEAMIAAGQLGRAEEDLKRILRAQSTLADYGLEGWVPMLHMRLAKLYFDQGAHNRSLQSLAQVQDPEDPADIVYIRAWNQLMMGQYQQGMASFNELAREYPGDARSIEATVLGGYILLNMAQFAESYAYFNTLETQYHEAAAKVQRFRRGFRSVEALDKLLHEPSRLADAPVPAQIADWVLESREVAVAEAKQQEVEALGLKIQNVIWDLQRIRVISAGFGSSFENPATLERLLRNEVGLRMTRIRSQILELMLKPVRSRRLAARIGGEARRKIDESYRLINLAQSVRKNALDVIRTYAVPTKERAVKVQYGLRKIQEYLYLVAGEELWGEADPARMDIAERVQFNSEPQQLIGRLIDDEEKLAGFLLQIMEEEEQLWDVVSTSIQMERGAAETILRNLRLWGKQAYLDRLELLYRSTTGIEEVLRENGRILLEIQRSILDDVLRYTDQRKPELQALADAQERLETAANEVRLGATDRGYDGVVASLREAESRSAAGKLDLGWRIKEVESEMMRDVLLAQQDRMDELEGYYANAREKAEEVATNVQVLDRQLQKQISGSVAGGQTVELSRSIELVTKELDRMEAYVNELEAGSARILERSGEVRWKPEIGR